jgi:hypothetical protein
MSGDKIIVRVSTITDLIYVQTITEEIERASADPSTSILKRSASLIAEKIMTGNAVIAVTNNGKWVGFCYLQTWSKGEFVANCGLVVAIKYRRMGVALRIKKKIIELSKQKYPESKLFGLTTSLAVMKINSDLGYKPVTYAQITRDDDFWSGCKHCNNYAILEARERKNCLCTAMIYTNENIESY